MVGGSNPLAAKTLSHRHRARVDSKGAPRPSRGDAPVERRDLRGAAGRPGASVSERTAPNPLAAKTLSHRQRSRVDSKGAPRRVSPLAHRIRRVLRQLGVLTPHSRVVVGVSGGPDSLGLLAILAELRATGRSPRGATEQWSLWAVYVNHGWRPRAVRQEIGLLRRITGQLKIPLVVTSISPAKHRRQSWEGTAREARYEALAAAAVRVRARLVMVGHTLEDQAETVLLALFRGTGLTGASGMPAVRPLKSVINGGPAHCAGRPLRGSILLVRPLLGVTHAELKADLRRRNIPWAADATNRRMEFRRNWLRARWLPRVVREYGPAVLERLATFAELVREDDAWLEGAAAHWGRRHARLGRRAVCLPVHALRQQPPALQRRILRWVLERAAGSLRGMSFRHVEMLRALVARGSGMAHLPKGLTARVPHNSRGTSRAKGHLQLLIARSVARGALRFTKISLK